MLIQVNELKGPRAKARIVHERPYDYDEKRGVWLRRVIDEQESSNIVTDAGRVRIHTYLYGSGGQRSGLGGGLNYLALSDDSTTPAAGDTALTSELTSLGLARAATTVTLPTGSGTQTALVKVFTFLGAGPQGVQKMALFDSPSAGTMAHEIQFVQRTLFLNDNLTFTVAINLA
jgi:hypothetical protein